MVDLTKALGPNGFIASEHEPEKKESRSFSESAHDLSRHLADCGIMIAGLPIMDGDIHRVHCDGDKRGSRNGWYVFFSDGDFIAGAFGSWRDHDMRQNWCSKDLNQMTVKEKEEMTHKFQKARQLSDEATKKRQAEAAIEAVKMIERCPPASETQEYSHRKCVKPTPGVLQDGIALIIPMYNEAGEIRSYQSIYQDGKKMNLKGGQKKDCFHLINGKEELVLVCEGWATGASLYQASGATVYVAGDTGNLKGVTAIAKRQNPSSKIIVCADNDRFTTDSKNRPDNPGVRFATEAANHSKVLVSTPRFTDTDADSSDFNDLHVRYGIALVKQALGQDNEAPLYREEKEDDDQVPPHLLCPPGNMEHMTDYYNMTARAPQPAFAVQAALAICSTILGRRFRTNKKNYATLYFMNIARSSTGKEHVKTVIEEILEACGEDHFLSGGGYTSAGAVFSTLLAKPCHIAIIDEMGKYLEASKSAANVNARDANRIIMEAIGRCHGTLRPTEYSRMTLSDSRQSDFTDRKVFKPALAIMGLTTPCTFYSNVSRDQIRDGFMGRFIIHHSDANRMVGNYPDPVNVPDAIIEWVKRINERYENRGNLLQATSKNSQMKPDEIEVRFTHAAIDQLSLFDQECIDKMNELERDGIEALAGRTHEFAMRMALICALSADPEAEEIDATDANWAIDYMRFHMNQTIENVKSHMVASIYEKEKKEILNAIRKSNDGITNREMKRQSPFRKYHKNNMERILLDLQEAGFIDNRDLKPLRSKSNKGRAAIGWVAIDPDFEGD